LQREARAETYGVRHGWAKCATASFNSEITHVRLPCCKED